MRRETVQLGSLWDWTHAVTTCLGLPSEDPWEGEKANLSASFLGHRVISYLASWTKGAKVVGFVLLSLCLVGVPQASFAEAWQVTPTVRLEEQYDDNINLNTESSDDVLRSAISGDVELSRLTEILEFRGRTRLEYVHSTGDDDLDNRNTFQPFVSFSSLYRPELNQWRFEGNYRRDTTFSTTRLQPGLGDGVADDDLDIGDDDIDVGLVRERIVRNRLNLRPSWTRSFTERTDFRLAYRFSKLFYEDAENTGLFDSDLHLATGTLFHRLTERDQVSAEIRAGFLRSSLADGDDDDADRDYDSYALLVGIDHAFSETTRGGVQVGVRHTTLDTTEEGDDDDTGFLFRLDGSKDTRWARFRGSFQRRLAPSGSGDVNQTDEFRFDIIREISPRLNFLTYLRFFHTESVIRDNPGADRDYISVEPRLSWNLTRWWTVEAAYRYRWQDRDSDSESADSNAVFVSLRYERPTALFE